MQMELKPVEPNKKDILLNLFEKYDYEFSQYLTFLDVNELGLYNDEVPSCYWQNDGKHVAYFIEVDKKLAGFVMVADASTVGDRKTDFMIDEFFVMYKYRRLGIGKQAFFDVLKKHRGRWQVYYHPKNTPAVSFWEKAINEFTRGEYELINSHPHPDYAHGDGISRNVIFFDNSQGE